MFKLFFRLLLGLSITNTCIAMQKIPIEEGGRATVQVSTQALNRIAVENDRILTVKGTSGQFQLDKDADLGQIFIKPTQTDQEDPIHLFITTEKGKTYALGLLTHELAAESIVLVPKDLGIAAEWEHSGAYETLIKEIIKAMHTQEALEGFSVESAKIALPKVKGAKISHLQSYSGNKLLGEILEVVNTTSETLYLNELDFYGEGVRAVAIINKALPSHNKTRIYRVRS